MVKRIINYFLWPSFRTRLLVSPIVQRVAEYVAAAEVGHGGEVRLCIEGSVPLGYALRGLCTRERATELFASEGVWDTEQNTGVLVYISLAERTVEVLCDRGVKAPQQLLDQWVSDFTSCAGESLHDAIIALVGRVGDHLRTVCPGQDAQGDELRNQPTVL